MTEQEKLQAMLKFTDAQWQQKQEEMSHETRVPVSGKPFNKKANIPEGEPPHGYICYRCGKKGMVSNPSQSSRTLLTVPRSLDPSMPNQ
jgi:hypothetical protein